MAWPTLSMLFPAFAKQTTTSCLTSSTSNILRSLRLQPCPTTTTLRAFSTTPQSATWLMPQNVDNRRYRRGQVHVATGGSVRGTTVVWGDYGLRMVDKHRRISALQLKNGEETIRKRLRGMNYRLYSRVNAGIPIWKKGNEMRMGGGKGSFDHWASRVGVMKVIFEIKGDIHEKIARDALRLAAAKMPGIYEFAKKGDPPVIGLKKLTPEYAQELIDSKYKLPFKLQKIREMQKAGIEVPMKEVILAKDTSMTPGRILPLPSSSS
ncbi:mitochondrial ribosomal large subunit component [Orbilia oligospora]|uniref:Mitochondrial ribosomal large subunit component n=1 Tax=Orbilia oligospora TaxID=2813651 RepID=A0A6G1M651_ORBOL|nr:mitochondrial ribosomal large subunit component [Orbilia oligospora]KAF3245854.1 mitochondrial ribosomal large subunit component [Orbilia oligospora]